MVLCTAWFCGDFLQPQQVLRLTASTLQKSSRGSVWLGRQKQAIFLFKSHMQSSQPMECICQRTAVYISWVTPMLKVQLGNATTSTIVNSLNTTWKRNKCWGYKPNLAMSGVYTGNCLVAFAAKAADHWASMNYVLTWSGPWHIPAACKPPRQSSLECLHAWVTGHGLCSPQSAGTGSGTQRKRHHHSVLTQQGKLDMTDLNLVWLELHYLNKPLWKLEHGMLSSIWSFQLREMVKHSS